MGCDIHLYIEVKQDDKWILFPGKWPNSIYDKDSQYRVPKEVDHFHSAYFPVEGLVNVAKIHASFYVNRNYNLFGMLAGVRREDFMGIQYGGKKSAKPRGIPNNTCQEIKEEVDNWGDDGHSHSWLTLQELNDFDWHENRNRHHGVVNYVEYCWFVKHGKPRSWSGSVIGAGIIHISNAAMDDLISKNERLNDVIECSYCQTPQVNKLVCDKCGAPLNLSAQVKAVEMKNYYTSVIWSESYYESAADFVDYHLPLLNEFVKGYEDLRIVFWFDN